MDKATARSLTRTCSVHKPLVFGFNAASLQGKLILESDGANSMGSKWHTYSISGNMESGIQCSVDKNF